MSDFRDPSTAADALTEPHSLTAAPAKEADVRTPNRNFDEGTFEANRAEQHEADERSSDQPPQRELGAEQGDDEADADKRDDEAAKRGEGEADRPSLDVADPRFASLNADGRANQAQVDRENADASAATKVDPNRASPAQYPDGNSQTHGGDPTTIVGGEALPPRATVVDETGAIVSEVNRRPRTYEPVRAEEIR
jgi:hypothetical protein